MASPSSSSSCSFSSSIAPPPLLVQNDCGKTITLKGGGFVILENVSHPDPEGFIVKSARVSYANDNMTVVKSNSSNVKLLNYLIRNQHTSPLESVSFTFHFKVPLSIATQILRHRTAKVNCVSHRYTKAEDGRFDPVTSLNDVRFQDPSKKQMSLIGDDNLAMEDSAESLFLLYQEQIRLSDEIYKNYEKMLKLGAAREQARFYLPCATFTRMYWTMDVHNLLHFLILRIDSHAQPEIQEVAKAILELIEQYIPNIIQAYRCPCPKLVLPPAELTNK